MKNRSFKAVPLAVLLAASGVGSTASAFTGKEIMEVFSQTERGLYTAGLIDMAAFQQAESGNTDRATCVSEWYWSDDNGRKAQLKIEQAAQQFPDYHVERVVAALIKRACPVEE